MIKDIIKKLAYKIGSSINTLNFGKEETELLALGKLLCNQQQSIISNNITDYEFKIFSQFGEDGIIQFLINNIKIENETFIEFGVENYLESNTRFLLMNNNWSGFVMDGSTKHMNFLSNQKWYWKYDIKNKAVFIDKENINELLKSSGFKNLGILSIDIDGNDYHIFENIDLSELNPSIIIFEYNSVFGKERAISVPYNPVFDRTKAHYSNMFWGASLPAFDHIANKRGYSLVGCNTTGMNAFYVRNDLLNETVCKKSINECFIESKFKQGLNKDGSLSYLDNESSRKLLKGLKVINVKDGKLEDF
jgi:hypothetical protein